MSTAAPTLDDIDSNAHNLSQLLDALVENLLNIECPASRTDLSRAAAFAMIARDMSLTLGRDIDTCNTATFAILHRARSGAAA